MITSPSCNACSYPPPLFFLHLRATVTMVRDAMTRSAKAWNSALALTISQGNHQPDFFYCLDLCNVVCDVHFGVFRLFVCFKSTCESRMKFSNKRISTEAINSSTPSDLSLNKRRMVSGLDVKLLRRFRTLPKERKKKKKTLPCIALLTHWSQSALRIWKPFPVQGFPEARAKPEATHHSQTACETCESAWRIRQHELGRTGSASSCLWASSWGLTGNIRDSPYDQEIFTSTNCPPFQCWIVYFWPYMKLYL